MSTLPLISIVTPVFNNAQFIERCIESVLAQDYPNVEHIIQDGASTDGTVDILRRYTGQVDWVSEPDMGQSDGLNRALQRCRGDIIGVLNADDEYLPHTVSWAVENFAKYPEVAVVFGDQYDVDENGKVLQKTHGLPYDFEKILCVEQVIPAQAAFIKSTYFEQVGFFADVTRKTCPDYEMWVRIGLKFPMQYVSGLVVKYRWHPQSEGRQSSIVPGMVTSKREVLERVFNDPTTPPAILSLQRRAHSGAVWWGACMFLWNGEVVRGLFELLHALYLYPSIEQMPRLRYFANQMYDFAKPSVFWHQVARLLRKSTLITEKGLALLNIKRKGNFVP